MSASSKGPLTMLTIFVLVLMCCALTVFGEEASRSLDQEIEDDVLVSQRELREYDQESWHVVQNTPEGASGWIPRDPIDSRPGVVYTKRRRLRKRKRRPPVPSLADEGLEDILKLTRKSDETENHKDDTAPEDEDKPKRRRRPNLREPWEEMQEESVRPYVRRKVTPAYQTSEDSGVITSSSTNLKALGASIQFDTGEQSITNQDSSKATKKAQVNNGKPNTAIIKEKNTLDFTTGKTPPNLKAILKQNGGVSLSEILQQKNLTLSQLLMGNQEAIKALTGSSEDIPSSTAIWQNNLSENLISSTQKSTSASESLDNSKYKRLRPSVALKKDNINRKYEQYGDSRESLTDNELKQAQRKRLALLQGHGYKNVQTNKFPEVTRYEVITEPTTEKRIFVPSHPKLYTSIDYKPEFSKIAETHTESYKSKTEASSTKKATTEATTQTTTSTIESSQSTTQPTKATKLSSTKSKLGLPITSSKLNKMVSKRVISTTEVSLVEEENYPTSFKPLKVNVNDIFGSLKSENQAAEKESDGPYRMSIDLEPISDQLTPRTSTTEPSTTKTPHSSTSTASSSIATSTSTQDPPKLKPFSAKDEIEEILKDSEGKDRLAKILEARNMTIEELIEQRERGSSQLHLADIFHNKTKEPEPLEEAFEGRIGSENFTSFPVFIRQPKSLLAPEKTTQKTMEASSLSNNMLVTAFPSFKIEVPKELPDDSDKRQTFPWKQLYPDLFNVQDQDKESPVILPEAFSNGLDLVQNQDISAEVLTEEDIQRLEEIDQRLFSSISSEQLNVVDDKIHKIIKIPSGVQSAIVASLVIVGLSLLVFMTILVVFRWMQKRKTNIRYCDSLKPPLFEVKPQNIKTFVTKTLDRSKVNYYKNNLQNMSDSSWDRE